MPKKDNTSNMLLEYIIEIKESTAAMKQHLKDMNGKLVKINTECPVKHKILDDDVKDIQNFVNTFKNDKKWIMFIMSGLFVLLQLAWKFAELKWFQ